MGDTGRRPKYLNPVRYGTTGRFPKIFRPDSLMIALNAGLKPLIAYHNQHKSTKSCQESQIYSVKLLEVNVVLSNCIEEDVTRVSRRT